MSFRLTGQAAITNDTAGICSPDSAIEYDEQIDTALEFQKPLGTGTDIWPSTPTAYAWSLACTKLDDLNLWWTLPSNRDAFAHVTHTFTHEGLNNATYADTSREVKTLTLCNFITRLMILFRSLSTKHGWPRLVSTRLSASRELVSSHRKYSYHLSCNTEADNYHSAITGMHNGDALQAFVDNGIVNGVGDNTRPVLMNSEHEHWPLISTVESNGYAGFQITPRWATTIYYNCDLPACTVAEWIATSAGAGDIQDLLVNAVEVNTKHLLSLHHDPYVILQYF